MKFKSFKTFTNAEIVAIILFAVYILFPVQIPTSLKPYVSSPIGLIFMFAITVALFVYTNPVLGVLYIFVVYETLRRSQYHKNFLNTASVPRMGKSGRATVQKPKNEYVQPVNPTPSIEHTVSNTTVLSTEKYEHTPVNNIVVNSTTLEEEIVQSRAPIGISEPVKFSQSSFSPVSDRLTTSASLF